MRRRYPHGFTTADVDYPEIDESTLAEINYTSGTTGFSKGVMLTLGNLGATSASGWHPDCTTADREPCRFYLSPMPTDVPSTC